MNRVFGDSSFWIALRDRGQPLYLRARTILEELLRQRVILTVTLPVFAETHAYFSRSPKLRNQILLDFTENPIIRQEELSPLDQTEAVRLLRQHRDKEYSLCDALSFVLMRRLAIRRAAAFDHHFHQYGEFEVLS